MLAVPTNNFGLAQLFKNFVLVSESVQMQECEKLAQKYTEQLEKVSPSTTKKPLINTYD